MSAAIVITNLLRRDFAMINANDLKNFIVNKNHIRKDNDLSFYPFDKSMDKYGTIYVSDRYSLARYKEYRLFQDKYSGL